MLSLFLAGLVLSIDTVTTIRKQISQSKFQAAYQAADSLITREGMLDADPALFLFRGISGSKIGKYDQSIADLSRFLRSGNVDQKDKTSAQSARGFSYLKLGNLEDSQIDAESSKDANLQKQIKSAKLLLQAAQSNETTAKVQLDKYQQLSRICSASATFLGQAADAALQLGNSSLFVDLSQRALALSPRDSRLLQMRGQYHLTMAEFIMAQKYLKLCIGSASDASKCTALLRATNSFQTNEKAASAAAAKKNFTGAQTHVDTCQKIVQQYAASDSPLATRIKGIQVKILLSKDKKEEAVNFLNDLIKASPKNDDLLIQRGELLIDLGDYDGALADLQTVRKRTKNNQKVLKLIEKASQLQEKEKNVDYYTVLGLKRGASMREIKDAYRKSVIKWHPDRFKEPLKKKEAEKKMKMINRAYDVLGDEQKKRMYDLGQDPENPMPNGSPPNDSNDYHQYSNFRQNGQSFTFNGFPGGGASFGGFGGFEDIIKQMMGGGGNFQFTTSQTRTNNGNKQNQKRTVRMGPRR